MKIQTGCLEREFEIVEDAPSGHFLRPDQVLIGHVENPSRQNAVPVSHELAVAYIEVRDLRQVISKRESVAEAGLVDRIAGGKWVARQMYDARLGERAKNEGAIVKIGRGLVREAGSIVHS